MRYVFITLLLIGISACSAISTTHTLGSLQEDYRATLETEGACSKGSGFPEVCMGDFKAQYGLIEYQAKEAIKPQTELHDIGDQQIAIALYRLAAYASLSANSGNAADLADAGIDLCKKTDPPPPRDCALLTVLGQYEVVEQFGRDVDCTIGNACPSGGPTAESLVAGFCSKDYNKLVSKTQSAKTSYGTFLSDSVVVYMNEQIEETKDWGMKLTAHITKGIPFDRKPQNPCACARQGASAGSDTLDCGHFGENARAILLSYCINDSLVNDSSCPEF